MRSVVCVLLAGLAMVTAGCAREGGGSAGGAAVPGIDPNSRIDLDGGRVTAFSPRGWRRAPRSSDSLVRYQPSPQVVYPAVVVMAADPPEGFAEVTATNHSAFAETMATRVAESDGKGVLRKPERTRVGPHHATVWSASGEARLDGRPRKIARDCTAVVVGGRMYIVEAWEPRDKTGGPGPAAARAVAAALSVPVTNEPAEPVAGTPEPEAEPTAVAEPAAGE